MPGIWPRRSYKCSIVFKETSCGQTPRPSLDPARTPGSLRRESRLLKLCMNLWAHLLGWGGLCSSPEGALGGAGEWHSMSLTRGPLSWEGMSFFPRECGELRCKRGGVAFCLPLEGPPLGPSYTATEGRWSWGPWSLFRENQGCEKFFMMLVVKVCDGNRQPLSQAPPPWPSSLSDGDARLKAFFTQPQKTILWMFAIGSQLNL